MATDGPETREGESFEIPEGYAETASPPAAIRMRGLTKSYDGKLALDGLDLCIREGEIFGYIGPNGAGKTTTLRILAALLLPTRGGAELGGVDVVRKPRQVKEIVGYMPDAFGVYDNMTLEEYLGFFASAYRIPRARRKRVIDDVLALTDLEPKRADQVSAFSRGMKQRACLAKTLLHDPKVLLLDEPASGLDPRARIEFREILKELKRMGKTILVSSHILADLALVCDSVGIIEAGKLVVAGAVKEILKGLRPHREFSLTLLDPDDCARVRGLLEARANVRKVEADGAGLRVSLVATDAEVADLVDRLVAERARLTGFHEESVDLEEAFMALTKGKLA